MIAGIWTDPMVMFGSLALVVSILLALWAVAHPEIRCAYCGALIHAEDDWWVDEDDELVCQDNHGDLGPHQPEDQPRSCQSAGVNPTP